MKRICFVLSDSNTKGPNGSFIELIDSLDSDEFNFYVILPSTGPMVNELKIRGISFRVFYYKWWMREQDSAKWKKLARIMINFIIFPVIFNQIRKWHCDIIYTNTIVISVGLFSAIILRKAHIFHIHEFGYDHHKLIFDFGTTASLWLANRYTKYFVCVSHAVAEKYAHIIGKNKIKVIYQSVTIPSKMLNAEPPAIKKHKFQCIIVGRLFENKGQMDAIKAVSHLISQEHLDIGLWIVGDGHQEYEEYLKKIVEENNLGKFIVFLGWRDNPFPLVKKSDIAFMCSKSEGFGRVTIEAMLLGKLVIGARSGATTELIKDGFNGFLYQFGDFEDLAKKIQFCYENFSLTHQIGVRAKKWASEQFIQQSYGAKIAALLR